jgi:hypothetical protein
MPPQSDVLAKIAEARGLTLGTDGAERICGAIAPTIIRELETTFRELAPDRAGIRLHGLAGLQPLLAASGPIGTLAAERLGPTCRPVRAILFDKTLETNWSLPWHQDRTIAVAERIEGEDFGPWTIKDGLLHVAPPFRVLAGMITLRVHLDAVPPSNAPLLIAPGSHRLGRIAEAEVPNVVKRCGIMACLADAGDVWVYSTPILHASEAAREPAHRRVLQVDFTADDLPGGLQWLGV